MTEQQLADLIHDALRDFIRSRTQQPCEAYFNESAPWPTPDQFGEQRDAVQARILAARKLQRLSGQIAETFGDAVNDLGDLED
jgi:hypothetical protein